MTSKETERKALEQIRKIVEGLGEDSYIGMAFDGCFEIAEQNIENDWACSMKQRAESAEERLMLNEKRLALKQERLDNQVKQIVERNGKLELMEALAVERGAKIAECECEIDQLKNRLSKAQSEIVNLKAKLYDMMMEKAGE